MQLHMYVLLLVHMYGQVDRGQRPTSGAIHLGFLFFKTSSLTGLGLAE